MGELCIYAASGSLVLVRTVTGNAYVCTTNENLNKTTYWSTSTGTDSERVQGIDAKLAVFRTGVTDKSIIRTYGSQESQYVPLIENLYMTKGSVIEISITGVSCKHSASGATVHISNASSTPITYNSSNQSNYVGSLYIPASGGGLGDAGGYGSAELYYEISSTGYYTVDACGYAYGCDQSDGHGIYITDQYKIYRYEYPITYNLNGGTVSPSNPTTYHSEMSFTLNNPTRTGYIFKGWSGSGISGMSTSVTIPTGTEGDLEFTANWEPIKYTITYNGNGNWNTNSSWSSNEAYKGKYTQTLTYDASETLTANQFTRNNNDTNEIGWCPYDLTGGYTFIGWDKDPTSTTPEFSNQQSKVFNLTTTNNANIDYYAIWRKTLSIKFDYNGGIDNTGASYSIKRGYIYNNSYQAVFDISDMYGTYDSNGMNTKFTRIDTDTGKVYRFIGWSTDSNASEPDPGFCVYDSSRIGTYTLHDSITLYAIWEEVLTTDIELHRSLGTLTFNDGTTLSPDTLKNLTSNSGTGVLYTLIKPGEQGEYTIKSTSTDATVKVTFDSRITDIYNHQGTWTDNLNPSGTGEELNTNQKHGLDRTFNMSDTIETRKFYIPQYLGTNESYITSNPSQGAVDTGIYYIAFTISKPSYYYRLVHGTDEQVQAIGIIYIIQNEPNPSGDPEIPVTVLDELRTRLKTRLVE